MNARKLFIFVEGSDDERFFSRIIRPRLENRYEAVEIILFASMKSVKVSRFIQGIRSLSHDYIVVTDIDQEPDVHGKKAIIMSRFEGVDDDRIVVIIREIESWYLAGLDEKSSAVLGIRFIGHTDFVTKEHFNSWIPRRYPSRIAFMAECLRHFSLTEAVKKNRSFRFFMRRYILEPDVPGPAISGTGQTGGDLPGPS